MSLRTAYGRVRGLGSAKSGTEHWWHQRLTSVALVPLVVFLVILIVSLIGADHAATTASLSRPLVAAALVLSLLTIAWHMHLGMQVIIEDYVHREGWKYAALIGNSFFTATTAFAGIYAVLKLSFGA
jgi:succinate dehydrogenase / fumarate reductase membrane anchor subunit